MAVDKNTFCAHFWGDRLKEIPGKTKNERYTDFLKTKVSLGRYIVIHSRIRPGMLVKIKPMFSRSFGSRSEEYVAIFMEAIMQPRAGERWFRVFHEGHLKEILDYELYEVLIESL